MTSKPILLPYTREHARQMCIPFNLATVYKKSVFAATGLVDGEPFGCGGIVGLWEGVGEAWTFLTPAYKPFGGWMFKQMRTLLPLVMEAYNLHRVQAATPANFLAGTRLLEHLGFQYEGKMKKYNEGQDYRLYALVKDK